MRLQIGDRLLVRRQLWWVTGRDIVRAAGDNPSEDAMTVIYGLRDSENEAATLSVSIRPGAKSYAMEFHSEGNHECDLFDEELVVMKDEVSNRP